MVVDMPVLALRAEVSLPATIDDEQRTVDLIWTTGADVERMDWWTGDRYIERLSLDPAHVRLDRLNNGAPLLDSHAAYSVMEMLGACVPGSAVLMKSEGRVQVRFSKRKEVDGVWQDVRDGLIRFVSVGYRIYRYEESQPKGNKLPVRLATDWEPMEVSMVPIPADAGAHARGEKPKNTNQCRIVPRAAVAPMDPAVVEVASRKESSMVPETQVRSEFVVEQPAAVAPPKPAPAAAAVEPNDRDRGATQERARVQGILNAVRAARLPQSFADALIADGTLTLEQAQSRVFAEMSTREADVPSQVPSGHRVEVVGDDPLVHSRAGIENAILHRVAGGQFPEKFKLSDNGRQYRGMSILDIGRAFLHARGLRTTQMSRSDLAEAMLHRAGLHSTSDFPALLADVANKTLRAAYEAAPQTWRPLAKMVPLSDFKPSNILQIGDAPALLEVLEHGEVTSGTITEGKETVRLKTFARIFGITRQALINDDLNAFAQVPSAFGRKAADLQSDLAWAQITSNPAMNDTVALFHTDHANLSGTSDAISVTSLGAARAALRKQTGIDGETLLNLPARFLIVPAAKETIADQHVSVVTPAQSSNVNPFQPGGRTPLTVIAEPRLDANSGTAWYVATDAASAPVLNYATLDGNEGPDVRQEEGFSVDGLRYRCRLDVNFAPADFRAIYKNPGA